MTGRRGSGTRFTPHKRGCILTALSWEGDLPLPGEFVKSAHGRTAFMIVEVRKPIRPVAYVAKFVCERRSASSLEADARVHEWVWAKR